ncbi:cof-like hydrolase family protein [Lapidilactobacillus dextrinicus DSM 20335]|uniref:Cof-like hydrolase family protein n=1 Tax=Lapidilactobacillus dextrinicus DSM 20335 TaxID=1423738 RepID=A0A0R2BU87_9LACO|nr:Cof-type HAD-IIB family hydrolase [Lapidilactobacillus dextrinicus]KRM79542.1 cof-like hydrolase family protein [Lapidilactobacillus dextrinicus DSM 20335]QFG46626.1 Cof-type HAD-IIB family hydrolase [Lapidilactobacillus dextrinicus]
MISIIASDMDGTLLNDKMEISPENTAAIKKAQAAGIEFIVATGRGLSEAQPLLNQAGLDPAYITLNGAQVFDTAGQLVVNEPLTDSMAKQLATELRAQGFYFELVTNRGVYSESKVRRIQNVADLLVNLNPDTTYKIAVALAAARLEIMNINYVDNYDQLLDDRDFQIMKILVFSSEGPDTFVPIRQKYIDDQEIVITSSSPNNIEINSIKAQKGLALLDYAKQKNISADQVMAIGDNMNDYSMITAAGVGVAMGNAIPVIKQVATFTTATNIKNGVAQAIDWALMQNSMQK